MTVGTPDANGAAANSVGFTRLNVITDDSGTGADESDIGLKAEITDVRSKPTLVDYTGELQSTAQVRFTDRDNAVAPGGGTDAATMVDIPFPFNLSCAATAATGTPAGNPTYVASSAVNPPAL